VADCGEEVYEVSYFVADEARTPNVSGVLPTTLIGSPDTVVDQVKRCREEVGVAIIDLMLPRR
jgi:hypothetical protein